MSQVFVDPDELEAFLNHLIQFGRELQETNQRLRMALGRLQNTWRDQEYEKFISAYLRTEKELQSLIQEIEQVSPKIRADIDFIRSYIQQQI
ncbi:MAG: WXG100 family type VII secretion target [Candidatus Caldarchaeum sp.]